MSDTAAAAIVLAAGASLRLGQPKQFLLVEGEPLVRRAARVALEAGAEPVLVVVTPAYSEPVGAALAGMPATVIENPDAAEGMGSTLRHGVAALLRLAPEAGSVLVLVCDQPGLTAGGLRRLLAAAPEDGIAAAAYAGRCGVPAVFARQHFAALAAAEGDEGARGLLRTLPVEAVPMPEAALDIDTPEDLATLARAQD